MPILAQIYGEVRFCAHQQVSRQYSTSCARIYPIAVCIYSYIRTDARVEECEKRKERKTKYFSTYSGPRFLKYDNFAKNSFDPALSICTFSGTPLVDRVPSSAPMGGRRAHGEGCTSGQRHDPAATGENNAPSPGHQSFHTSPNLTRLCPILDEVGMPGVLRLSLGPWRNLAHS